MTGFDFAFNNPGSVALKWVFNNELGFPQCPACKRWLQVYQGDAKMNYCPNCGIPLDGEEFEKRTQNGQVISGNTTGIST